VRDQRTKPRPERMRAGLANLPDRGYAPTEPPRGDEDVITNHIMQSGSETVHDTILQNCGHWKRLAKINHAVLFRTLPFHVCAFEPATDNEKTAGLGLPKQVTGSNYAAVETRRHSECQTQKIYVTICPLFSIYPMKQASRTLPISVGWCRKRTLVASCRNMRRLMDRVGIMMRTLTHQRLLPHSMARWVHRN